MKQSEIKFTVTLDDSQIPEKLEWEAGDSGMEGKKECRTAMIAIWDPKEQTTLRIDLWTKDMLIDDMKRFFYESLMTMADTYQKATNEAALAGEMKNFATEFGKKSGVLDPRKL